MSPQAYVDKFKFRSVIAEDTLEFYLEYFPDLKKKSVHKIEGMAGGGGGGLVYLKTE